MADESSSIALQLTINLKGLVKLTQLNAALKDLKTNAIAFQRNLASGNATLAKSGKAAQDAAKGLKTLNREVNNAAKAQKAARDTSGIAGTDKNMAKVFAKLVAERAKQQAALAKEMAKTQANMGKVFGKLQADQAKETARATAAAAKQQQQAQRAQTRAAEQAQRQQVAAAQRAANERNAIARAETARFANEMRRRQMVYANMIEAQKTLAGRLQRAEEKYDAIFRAGFRLQMVGRDIQQVGTRAIGVLQSMAKEFGDFEFMVNRATGAMGINKASIDGSVNLYDKFQGSIEDASRELKLFDPTDVAKATYFWASTTGKQINNLADLKQTMAAVNPLMKIAAMTETDYETAIKGVYSILIQYGLGLDQVQTVTEKLHTVTQLTAAEFPDLINSFKMVGPVAAANNVSFDDMVLLLGRLADAGIRGSMSGRALRQMFIQLNKPSAAAAEALDSVWKATKQFGGKSYVEMVFPKGQFVGVTKYVDMLATATANMTQHERNALLARITTANELPVLTALVTKARDAQNGLGDATLKVGNLGVEAAARFKNSWEQLATSWNGVVGGFTRGAEIIRIQIGRRIAEVFKPTLEALTAGLKSVSDWVGDSRNAAVIDFFVKLVGFSAGILAVAGAMTVFVGAMTSVAAAIAVGVQAFGPLVGKFVGIVGIIGAVGAAFARNFEYIRKTAEDVFKNISEAMGDSTKNVNGLSEAFSSFAAITAPIFDTMIHLVGSFVLALSELAKWIGQNKMALDILSVAAQALGVIMSVKLLKTMLGLVNVSKMLFPAWLVMAKLFGGMIAPTKALDGAFGRIPTRLERIKTSVNGLKSSIGPGGWLSIAAVALTLAYENNLLGFKDFVDNLFTTIESRIQQTLDQIAAAKKEAGVYAGTIDASIQRSKDYQSILEKIKTLEGQRDAGEAGLDHGGGSLAHIKGELAKARLELETFTANTYQTVNDWVQELNAAGSNITLADFMAQVNLQTQKGAKDFDAASKAAWDYFVSIRDGMKAADAQAQAIMGNISANRGERTGLYDFKPMTDDMKAALKSQLIEMESKVSPQVQEQIKTMLSDPILAGVVAAGDDPELAPTVAKTMGEISSTLLEGGKKLFDIDKQLTEIMKTAIRPSRQAGAIFKSYMKGWISKGFKDSDGHFHIEAKLFAMQSMDDLRVQFQTYMDALPPSESKKFINSTISQFKTDFKNGLPKGVTPGMATKLYQFISDVYAQAGKPIPKKYLDMFRKAGVTIPTEVGAGIDKAKPKVEDAARRAAAKAKIVNMYGDNAYAWGYDLVENYKNGMRGAIGLIVSAATAVANAIAKIIKHSTPDAGPLKDDDTWGLHFGQNIAEGIHASIPHVTAATTALANAVSQGYSFANDNLANGGVSIESNANRVVKVQVEVTSPDGSVSRIQAAQFERAMMSNDLIQSIEHMSTVG